LIKRNKGNTLFQVKARVVNNVSFFSDVFNIDRRYRDIRLMWLNCPDIARTVIPGQFVMVRCDNLTLPRPISVHQVVNESIALLFTVLADGKGTAWLADRQPDDILTILGPLGNGFYIDKAYQDLLLVSGGMGIAPLYFLAQNAVDRGIHTTLLLGAKTDRLLYPLDQLPVGIEVITATDDGSAVRKGLVTSLIPEYVDKAECVFSCGPVAMYRQMTENRQALGFENKPVQVSFEAIMGCGHGACYSCTIKTHHGLRQVCKDGPVFNLDDVVFGEMGL
jgi:dihydroorotate dehydrogenase electron transfer subunit